MTTPFRSLENAPFLENVLLTEAKITTNESLSMKVLNFSTCIISKDIPFFDRFWQLPRIYTNLNLRSYDLGFYSLFHFQNQQTSAN